MTKKSPKKETVIEAPKVAKAAKVTKAAKVPQQSAEQIRKDRHIYRNTAHFAKPRTAGR